MRLNVKSVVLFNVILLLCFLTLTYLNIIHVSHKGVQWQLDTGGNPYCEVPCALQRALFIPSSCRPTWADCTSPQYHVHTLHITAGLYRASHISSNTALLSNIAKQSQMRCDSWPRSVFVRYFETSAELCRVSHHRHISGTGTRCCSCTVARYTLQHVHCRTVWWGLKYSCITMLGSGDQPGVASHNLQPPAYCLMNSASWGLGTGFWVQSEQSALVLLQTWL